MSQTIYPGYGALNQLAQILESVGAQRIFLATGGNSYKESGAEAIVEPLLHGRLGFRFSDIASNPDWIAVKTAVAQCRENGCDYVLAIGGGSVIDTAKATALLAGQSLALDECLASTALKARAIGLAAVPTTAGTGSEATHFCTIYLGQKKFSLTHLSLVPDCVILDPALTLSLSPQITATTGADALCQAIESFWSVNATDEAQDYSRQALQLAWASLRTAVKRPDRAVRENMLLASNLSGRAINIAQTTIAHALSYPLTAHYGITHGQAVALTLPWFLEFNAGVTETDVQDPRGVAYVRTTMTELMHLLGVASPAEGRAKLTTLLANIGIATRLSELGKAIDIELVVREGLSPSRAKNNPRRVTSEDVRRMLEEIK